MNLTLNQEYAKSYKSRSQIIRILTEKWVEENAYCPRCGAETLTKETNNSPVLDFSCPLCHQGFELKSKAGTYQHKIVDGEYHSMIRRITSNTNPDFFFLNYRNTEYSVTDFFIVPKQFITTSVIEKRPPLSPTARRAGWIGCNIRIDMIPTDGIVFMIKDRIPIEKEEVVSKLRKTAFLEQLDSTKRGWAVDVMRCIDKLADDEFSLSDIYLFEPDLQTLHPQNNHIQAKIRQQLQILRDLGYIEFCGRGTYRKISQI